MDSFPVTCTSTTAANLALAASIASMVGSSAAHVSPLEHKNVLTLATEEGFAFDLMLQNGTRYRFDSMGAPRCIDDPNGGVFKYEHYNQQSHCLIFQIICDKNLHFTAMSWYIVTT